MVSLLHNFACAIADDPADALAGKVLPSHWIAQHDLLLSTTNRILGRKTAGAGAVEEVSLSELLDWIGTAARGDLLVRGAAAWSRLAIGTAGQLLKSDGTDAAWATEPKVVAWCKFNGNNGTVSNSFNVSSVTRNSAGNYTVNFTSAIGSADYATHVCSNLAGASYFVDTTTTPTTGLVRVGTSLAGVATDTTLVNVSVVL